MKIAIVGYDVEGQASYRYFSGNNNQITIFDEAEVPRATAPVGIDVISGHNAIAKLKTMTFDKVIRTPSLSPKKLEGINNVTTATREFFKACPAPIIGITGTKGKGTTASLIHAIFEASEKKSWLVGNIGVPALDVLEQISSNDVVIYELSSFQLWDLDISPHIAVVLMIEPDHLDIHENLEDYIHSKSNIRKYQGVNDVCIYHPTNKLSEQIAMSFESNKTAYKYADPASSRGVFVKKNTFFIQDHLICSVDILKIPGQHNVENACAAISAVLEIDSISDKAIVEGLSNFEGLPHRLKLVSVINGVKYYDDSIATTPGSVIAAIHSFENPKVLILGGSDKGADFGELYEVIKNGNVKQVITIGTMAEKIATELVAVGYETVTRLGMTTMSDIVDEAKKNAVDGDIVIMSPACASFDMFKSYTDRGEQFVAAVEVLAR